VLAGADLVAFLATTDQDRAEAFFSGTLGLELAERGPVQLVYRVGPTTLRVVSVSSFAPQSFTVAGWRVPDVDATASVLISAGVELLRYDSFEQDDLGIWTAPSGARVAWFKDPDGNVLSVQG
jgi:catechol 2,3-dioxygenase-like lactoylglutathione lyase family enzyme